MINNVDTDACLTNGQDARCGDNRFWQDQKCDDGNTNNVMDATVNCDIEERFSADHSG